MKFNEYWLREWVNPPIDTKTLAEQLTMAGLEVEEIAPVANDFSGIVVGLVKSAEQHPNADRLRVCEVDVGGNELLTIVCGGANVRPHIKVPVALVGAVLSENFEIKPSKLRGVMSQGMICSSQELGLEVTSEGILELPEDAPIGIDIREYLQLDDHTLQINLTPNRGDCFSVFGIAREVAAVNACDIPTLPTEKVAATSTATFPVKILASEDCPQYVGRVIENIDFKAKTPAWLKERLRRNGFRSFNCIVDVTNYILLELGQPLHAFDLNKLNGSIIVRRGKNDESLTLLEGKTIKLNPETLIIADEQKPLALAGIMGGLDSSITEKTEHVFLESAFFNPSSLAGQARQYGLSTDASHRFERFVSPELQIKAIERATKLLIEIGCGNAGPLTIIKTDSLLPVAAKILLRKKQILRILGLNLSEEAIEGLLKRLDMKLTSFDSVNKTWEVSAPLYRFDIKIEADLIEEIARIYGYNHINALPSPMHGVVQVEASNRFSIQNLLSHLGYQEAITYSFIDPKMHHLICPDEKPITLENPISSELSVMRSSLWPGLLQTAIDNQRHQQLRSRFFEIGLCFRQREAVLLQQPFVGGILTGTRLPEQWGASKETIDFYDAKNDIENLLTTFKLKGIVEFRPGEHSALHHGQTAQICLDNELIGYLGALHPKCMQELDLVVPVYLFEMALNALSKKPKFYQPLSKFPSVRRDIAILAKKEILAADLLRSIKSIGGESLQKAWVFDLYQGKGVDPSQKSIAIGLLWQHNTRTLLDDEISQEMEKIVTKLKDEFGATLRV